MPKHYGMKNNKPSKKMENKPKKKGLTEKQKKNLPKNLQKAILAKQNKK
jgi:hypothetical protein|tara:strand:+ start:268 stop:414 length:147 start_codon:yes stop_codon:yes gene_type:complete